jgi:hypothetical protein
MAALAMTLNQILEAVRQLPVPQRRKLLKEIEGLSRPEQALAAARQLRGKFRMGEGRRKRLSELLAKGNAGTLVPREQEELSRLVEESEEKTLALAQAIARTVPPSSPQAGEPAAKH